MSPHPTARQRWQRAAKLAAKYHQHQLRKDGATPYICHPIRVALTVRQEFGEDDATLLAAALLHDVIEDTTCDYDDWPMSTTILATGPRRSRGSIFGNGRKKPSQRHATNRDWQKQFTSSRH